MIFYFYFAIYCPDGIVLFSAVLGLRGIPGS